MEVFVRGGTNAGIKNAPKQQDKKAWSCKHCGASNLKYYWINCPICGGER